MQILKLSYDSLPSHLKPCFVYLSFFPEDVKIEYQYLINLWIAEGYVPHGEDQLDVGWNYICHLHSLCLVERAIDYRGNDIRYGWYDLYYRFFKVHDLLLDLAISIARESQCAVSVEEDFKKALTVQRGRRYRRILMSKRSIGDGDVDAMAKNKVYSASCLRTLSFSENGGIQNVPAILLNGARVLRVLDLSGTGISSLPDCVGNLKLLRVLNLSWTKITEVPECVRSNKSLRFLDIYDCSSLQQFPEWIGELTCLEHLDIRPYFGKTFEGRVPHGIYRLVSLQVLKLGIHNNLSVGESDFLKLEHFANLVNFRQVWINTEHEAELKSIEDGILATLVKMRNLTIFNKCSGNLPPLSEKMFAMKDLEYLYLDSFAVPNWICGFSNLMQLKLWNCHCAEYPALEMMPNLIKLELVGNCSCKALPEVFGKPGGFPQLRYFEICFFSELEELPEVQDGAMPRLEIPKVRNTMELLSSLKECHFYDTRLANEFKEGGELWMKIKSKNPNVKIMQDE